MCALWCWQAVDSALDIIFNYNASPTSLREDPDCFAHLPALYALLATIEQRLWATPSSSALELKIKAIDGSVGYEVPGYGLPVEEDDVASLASDNALFELQDEDFDATMAECNAQDDQIDGAVEADWEVLDEFMDFDL